jgi:hypothetical protein
MPLEVVMQLRVRAKAIVCDDQVRDRGSSASWWGERKDAPAARAAR